MAAGSKRVIYFALFGNFGIAITKFAASIFTGSSAMLTEAIHSLVDTGNQVLLLWGLRRSKKPPDAKFPFGHGKEIYFWSFVVAVSIFSIGAGVSIYEGIKQLQDPHPVTSPSVNYIVLVVAMVFEGVAWYAAFRGFQKEKGDLGYFQAVREGKDPTFFVVLFEDSAAMLGLVIAFVGLLLGQLTGIPHFDGAASVIIGLVLAGVAVWLAYETKSLLIGESASPTIEKEIREMLENEPNVEKVSELATLQMGPEHVLVTLSLDLLDGLSGDEIKNTVTSLNQTIRGRYPSVKRVFVEVESFQEHSEQLRDARGGPDDAADPADGH